MSLYYILLIIAIQWQTTSSSSPIVLWHGMGDSCCNPMSLGSIIQLLKVQLPESYVVSLRIGSSIVDDTSNSFFMNVNDQIDYACEMLKTDENLTQGYNAIG
jgi:palmitoyl-protein thioesterase